MEIACKHVVVASCCAIVWGLYIWYLVASMGLHFNGWVHLIYYIMKYCISLPSKYILIVIDSNSVIFLSQNMGYHQSVTECNKVWYNIKKCEIVQ